MPSLKFFVPAPLGPHAKLIPFLALNDYIAAERQSTYHRASQLKKQYTEQVAQYAAYNANLQGWVKPSRKVQVTTIYHELNHRRDFDNVCAADKFVMDGLVQAGVIANDSQKWLVAPNIHPAFVYDSKCAGVTVIVETEGDIDERSIRKEDD